MSDSVNNAGQAVADATLKGIEGDAAESAGTLASDVEQTGAGAAAGLQKLNDDVVSALETIIDHAFANAESAAEAAGKSLPFPLNLLAPSLFAAAKQIEAQLETEAFAELQKADAALVAKIGAVVAILKADLDKFVTPPSAG